MLKKILLAILIFILCHEAFSQVTDVQTMIDSTNASAVYFEVDLSKSDVKDAIDNYFDSMHIDKEKGKGFIIKKSMPYQLYKHAVVDFMQGLAMDYYFKIDTRKQKGPDVTTIYIAASQGYNNFLSPQNDNWRNLGGFAQYLKTNIFERFRLRQEIADLNKDLKKAKVKLDDIMKDKADAEKTIADKSSQVASLQMQVDALRAAPKQQSF